MYIYRALINALSAHMIYINLNMIFYTQGEHSPTGAKIPWEEESFQFGFKRWQGWAVSKILWEWIPNVGSKAREGAKAMSLAFVLLDFQHAGVRRRA